MSQSKPLYLGPRLRRLRRELGLTQQTMADDLGISASYVALLERNSRPLTAELLLRLAKTYRLDVADLAGEDAEDYARRLTDILRDPLFADIDLPGLEIADLATSFPGVTEALLRLHGAYAREQLALAALRENGGDDEAGDPVGEVRRFIAANRNFFPSLDARAEELAGEIAEAGGSQDWLKRKGVRLRYVPAHVLVDAVRRFDRHNQQVLIADTLPGPSRKFQVALHIAYTAMREDIATLLRRETFASKTGEVLTRRALAGYAAAALRMPYERFARAARERAYDVEALANLFGASFEQVAHRLTTLHRPGAEGVPFFFIRVDPAGNVSKRLDGAGFPFAAHGGGCPLWNVHSAFSAPSQVLTQWLELPDGQRFFAIARSVTTGGHSWGELEVQHAVALACAAEHAPQLVYARGSDPASTPATPIGVTCRICPRAQCTARAAPPIGREIIADDQRRAPAPYVFVDD
ncbi:short-chain fatty acyl-CoA regulator family protein [Novosphingobium sp. TH158]|uniref:helix-turn-helix domain-containing protein n=1 Tax=Novosphingobium sp. TH158 TaxID=2067455 RepID=UPI000C7C9CA3|nr:helix-turn-helix transcriptional regulator [Novosphingobium sp. TH158]PLK26221.1 XRE family transcriptional regulator [Novosphingobium sp. TH158]